MFNFLNKLTASYLKANSESNTLETCFYNFSFFFNLIKCYIVGNIMFIHFVFYYFFVFLGIWKNFFC